MPDPTEALAISYERYGSIPEWRLSEGRGLADMLLDSREIPRELPPRLAALVARLTEVARGLKTIRGLSDGVATAVPPRPEPLADLGRVVRSGQSQ
jgi:hypothetical protein